MTQNEVSIIENAVLDCTEAYVDARLSALDYVKTQIGVVQGYEVGTGNKYYHTVKCDNGRVTYTKVLSVGNIPFPANSVVFLIAPNAQFSNQFILGKLDDTPCSIRGGSINIRNNFIVNSNGEMWARAGHFYGAIEGGSININNRFMVDSNGNMTATSGVFSGTLSGASGTFSGNLSAASGTFRGELQAATGTLSDGYGTLKLSGGNLYMNNNTAGGAGVFATRYGDNNYYSCWGAVNSAARDWRYLEVPTFDVIVAGQNASDERLKKDIEDINDDFAEKLILSIHPKQFRYKKTEHNDDSEELNFGVIAQEILQIEKDYNIPERNRLCYKREMDDMLAVDYKQLIAPIIKVIQNQKVQIDKQQTQIDKLEKEIADLKKASLNNGN